MKYSIIVVCEILFFSLMGQAPISPSLVKDLGTPLVSSFGYSIGEVTNAGAYLPDDEKFVIGRQYIPAYSRFPYGLDFFSQALGKNSYFSVEVLSRHFIKMHELYAEDFGLPITPLVISEITVDKTDTSFLFIHGIGFQEGSSVQYYWWVKTTKDLTVVDKNSFPLGSDSGSVRAIGSLNNQGELMIWRGVVTTGAGFYYDEDYIYRYAKNGMLLDKSDDLESTTGLYVTSTTQMDNGNYIKPDRFLLKPNLDIKCEYSIWNNPSRSVVDLKDGSFLFAGWHGRQVGLIGGFVGYSEFVFRADQNCNIDTVLFIDRVMHIDSFQGNESFVGKYSLAMMDSNTVLYSFNRGDDAFYTDNTETHIVSVDLDGTINWWKTIKELGRSYYPSRILPMRDGTAVLILEKGNSPLNNYGYLEFDLAYLHFDKDGVPVEVIQSGADEISMHKEINFAVSPNPTSNEVRLILNDIDLDLNKSVDLNVYDMLGKKVLERKSIEISQNIDVSSLGVGMFVLEVVYEEKLRRFIFQKI